MSSEVPSIYLSTTIPPVLAKLNQSDIQAYLTRISLDPSLSTSPPSLSLLSDLLLNHLLSVPYDVTNLHVSRSSWLGENEIIQLGKGQGMPLGKDNFERVVRRNQGSYCYGLNTLFASLLRGLGFRVSEVGARVFLHRGKDPKITGWWFSPITHETLVVDWEGSNGERYLVDVGFGGGGCPYPILLKSGSTAPSLSRHEAFYLKEEPLPLNSIETNIHYDASPGFTLYRRIIPLTSPPFDPSKISTQEEIERHPVGDGEGEGYWTAMYHFTLSTLCPSDILMANWYNSTCPEATWMNFFVCSLYLKDGSRRTLSATGKEGEQAKIYEKKGVMSTEEKVRMLDFDTKTIRKELEKSFGFKFE